MKKNIKIILIVIVCIILGFGAYIFLKKENDIVGKYISDKEFSQDLFLEKNENSASGKQVVSTPSKKDEINYDKISSMIRTICLNIKDTKTLVNTSSFKLMKTEVTNIKKNLSEDSDKFTYVTLPGLVFSNCVNDDDTFIDKLVTLLQTDGTQILASSKEELNGLYSFIDSIKYDNSEIQKAKLKSSKEYFYEIFFQKNISPLMNAYFFETSYNLSDIQKYIYNTTFLSFGEVNNLLAKTVSGFQDFVQELGFKDLGEFNQYILKNNGYSDLDELKDDAIKKYNLLVKKVDEKFGYNLNDKLLTLDTLYAFYKSDDYQKFKNDSEIAQLYKEIAELHLYFAVIGGDYANNLSEGWSGKMFFGDSLIGNGIIRLFYIYYFDLLNNK